jgi:hypothetical protein
MVFTAFESALHVLPSNCVNNAVTIDTEMPASQTHGGLLSHDERGHIIGWPMDLERWNMDELWRNGFGIAAKGLLFFAEDVFGGQFALDNGKVWRFNPESAAREKFANNLELTLADLVDCPTGTEIVRAGQTTPWVVSGR